MRHNWDGILDEIVRDLADILAVAVLVALANGVVLWPGTDWTLVRAAIGLVFVLILPGYAVIAALFPEAGHSPTADDQSTLLNRGTDSGGRGIDAVERVSLSFALSIAIVALLVIGVSLSPVGITVQSTMVTISLFTLIVSAVAGIRRMRLPVAERFRVPIRRALASGSAAVFRTDSRAEAILNVALAVAIVLAMGTLTFAVLAPPSGEQFSEFYVVTENESGDLTAANYPELLITNAPTQFHVGIENYEQRTVSYTVVVQLQRIDGGANESVVTSRVELDRFSRTLGHNETSIVSRNLTAPERETGENFRLTFLLYLDSVPDQPTAETATNSLHLWVDVDTIG